MFSESFDRAVKAIVGTVTALAVVCLSAAALDAQEGAIAGQVLDAGTLQPIAGAQVIIPGTDIGTFTGGEGRYRLTDVPAGTHDVRARALGYRQVTRSVTVRAGETTTADFNLAVSAVALEELVVTAAGDQRARELGNTVSVLNVGEEVERSSPVSFTSLLKGTATGVSIQRSSGSVGTASTIKIRGASSIGLSTVPIIYVDGARIDNRNQIDGMVGGANFSRIDDINPADIESVEVVKGPAAAALYGTDSNAGVIRITTKQGRDQPTEYRARFEQGANWDVTDWWTMAWGTVGGLDLQLLTGVPAAKDTVYVQSLMEGTRFGDPFRTGHMQTYGGSIRGGTPEVMYFFSGEFRNNKGTVLNNGDDRYSARGNFSIDPGEKVDISTSSAFTSRFVKLPDSDNSLFSFVGNALGSPWWGPMTRSDPNFGGPEVETCFIAFELSRALETPLAEQSEMCAPENPFFISTFDKIFQRANQQDVERFTGSVTLDYRPMEMWTNRITVGYDQSATNQRHIVPVDPERPFFDQSLGLIEQFDTKARVITMSATSTVDVDLTSDVRSQTTAGVQWSRDVIETSGIIGREFPAGAPSVVNAVRTEATDAFSETRTIGVFVQEQLSWRDRIFLTPAFRMDDNSAFGPDLGLQVYPQVHFSWVMSDEAWLPDRLEQFRLRAAWGESGRQPGTNDAFFLLSPVPVTRADADVLGIRANRPGNPELRPETGEEWEAGFDASLFNNRLDVEFTYYNQTTKDAIVQRQLAPSLGFPGQQFVNIGKIKNRGVELALNGVAFDRPDFFWDWRFQLATNSNEVTELPDPIIFGFGSEQRHQQGLPFASYVQRRVEMGPDGEIVVGDVPEFAGHPTPEWEGSLSSTVRLFGNLTLFAQADFAAGQQLSDNTEDFNCGLFGGGGLFGSCSAIFQRNPDGSFTDEALIKQTAAQIGSSFPFIYDADYLKLRTVSARYELPDAWLGFAGFIRGASISVVGENLGTWTSYPGVDPEQSAGGSAEAFRSEFIGLPVGRRITGTLSITM